jgi:hypothetical protein
MSLPLNSVKHKFRVTGYLKTEFRPRCIARLGYLRHVTSASCFCICSNFRSFLVSPFINGSPGRFSRYGAWAVGCMTDVRGMRLIKWLGVRDVGLPPRCTRGHRSSATFFLNSMTLEGGAHTFSRNIVNRLPNNAAQRRRTAKTLPGLICRSSWFSRWVWF